MGYQYLKRLIDFLLAASALLILSPLFLPVCLVLLLTGEHRVFYLQDRLGRHNRQFKMWKFATMLKASPQMTGGLHTTRHDPRVLPVGRFLRKTKINELPQLFNILRGDMAIVGPRPLVDKTFAPYPEHVKKSIYNIRPGLTGIGSIVFRDEEQLLTQTTMEAVQFYARHIASVKGELELWYQKNISLRVDLLLIFLTAWVIFFPQSRLLFKLFPSLPTIEVPGLCERPQR